MALFMSAVTLTMVCFLVDVLVLALMPSIYNLDGLVEACFDSNTWKDVRYLQLAEVFFSFTNLQNFIWVSIIIFMNIHLIQKN